MPTSRTRFLQEVGPDRRAGCQDARVSAARPAVPPCRRRMHFLARAAVVLALTLAVSSRAARDGNPIADSAAAEPCAATMVPIPAGDYAPVLRSKDEPERIAVAPFQLDVRPVTNAEFLAFVRANPRWQRSRVSPLFADAGYLAHWAGDLELGPDAPTDSPVVRVSWFAARAFAASQGKRLPTTAEWERAAAAGFVSENGASERDFSRLVLAWLSQPTPSPLPSAGLGQPNVHGVRDLLGLVWEWVDDFNTAMTTGESRADTGLERNLFCGAGAAGAGDLTDYPAFVRAALRSSLRANYSVPNLGFRCARSIEPPPPLNP
jgi:formylglycine-generating enzyme